MIVTVKDLLQNTNKEDFENLSFTRGNCSKKELKELEKQIQERKDLTSKQAGSIGGEMVKRLVANAANQMQSQQPNQ